MIILTHENYHSLEANHDYMSRSQYVGFVHECEAKTMAKLSGAWVDLPSTALEVGHYVHSWNSGTQVEFIVNHPGMFTKANTLRADYQIANSMIESLQDDPFVMSYLAGEKDKIMTAEMYGAMWKIMMNVQSTAPRRIVDLRTTRSIVDRVWDEAAHAFVSFIEFYKSPLQVAIYSEVERIAMGRAAEDWSDFLIVAVSKEKYPDKAVINMTDHTRLVIDLAAVQANMPRIIALKAGQEVPFRCEKCDYCRSTKMLSSVSQYAA